MEKIVAESPPRRWFKVSFPLILLCLAGVLAMQCNAAVVITDSGGIQEETS